MFDSVDSRFHGVLICTSFKRERVSRRSLWNLSSNFIFDRPIYKFLSLSFFEAWFLLLPISVQFILLSVFMFFLWFIWFLVSVGYLMFLCFTLLFSNPVLQLGSLTINFALFSWYLSFSASL